MFLYSLNKESLDVLGVTTQNGLLETLGEIGLRTDKHRKYCKNLDEVEKYYNTVARR